jgi:zinc/manganese transport system ATP-binding protein
MTRPMVQLDKVCVRFGHHLALEHVSGHFEAGSLTAVIGANGAGKSTLLKGLANLLTADGAQLSGAITVAAQAEAIAYLPQRVDIDRRFPMNVYDCVLSGCWQHTGPWRSLDAGARTRVAEALHTTGLEQLADQPLGSLSGGQLQRVLFARLLTQDAQLILLDEPFSAVDAETTQRLLMQIGHWHRQGRTVIAAVHDQTQVRQHFPCSLWLGSKVLAWDTTHEVLAHQGSHGA